MKYIKKKNTVSTLLWKSYLFLIVIAIVMMIVPYLLCILFSLKLNNIEEYHHCSATDIMQDDYHRIDTSRISNMNGSIQVVTGNLEVITLCGEGKIRTNTLSMEEWTNFLKQSGTVSETEYSIAYNEVEDFWLIVELPVAKIEIKFVANPNMVEYNQIIKMLSLMSVSYIVVVVFTAIIYSQLTAKNFRKPFGEMCDYIKYLSKGNYQKKIHLKGLHEFEELEKDINQLAEQLEQEKKFREKVEENRTQLIRDISHDLKNPLMGIQGYVEYCLNKSLSQEELKEYLELIKNNSMRANDLLINLFEFAKIESADFTLKQEQVDLGEFLRQEIIHWIPELDNKQFGYEVDIPEKEMLANIDITQMKRVLANLISNALKYNLEGTNISLMLRKMTGKYEITFQDNGKGIEKEYIETIFDPFTRPDGKVRNSKDGGSGLGLAIVKKIITLHGGTVHIDSMIEKGTKFHIELPI